MSPRDCASESVISVALDILPQFGLLWYLEPLGETYTVFSVVVVVAGASVATKASYSTFPLSAASRLSPLSLWT